ncbi:hypothetical protein Tco_0351216 [Tanacetum coccineum]
MCEMEKTSPTSNVRITLVMPTNGGKGNFPTLNCSIVKDKERVICDARPTVGCSDSYSLIERTLVARSQEKGSEPNGGIRHHFRKRGQSKWLTLRFEGNEVGIQKKSPSECV